METLIRFGEPVYNFSFDVTRPDENGFFIIRIVNEGEVATLPLLDFSIALDALPPEGDAPLEIFTRSGTGFDFAGTLDALISNIEVPNPVPVLPGDAIFEIFAAVTGTSDYYENFPGGSLDMNFVGEALRDLTLPITESLPDRALVYGNFEITEATGTYLGTNLIETFSAPAPFGNFDLALNGGGTIDVLDIFGAAPISFEKIDRIQFPDEDTPLDLNALTGVYDMSEQEFRWFSELYVAYFNALPSGEDFLSTATALAGSSRDEIAEEFFSSQGLTDAYGGGISPDRVDAFVTSVYEVLLGRTPDAAGFDYWTSELAARLDGTGRAVELFLLDFVSGTKTEGALAADKAILSDKVDAAVITGAKFGLSPDAIDTIFGDGDGDGAGPLSSFGLGGDGDLEAFMSIILDEFDAAAETGEIFGALGGSIRLDDLAETFFDPFPQIDPLDVILQGGA